MTAQPTAAAHLHFRFVGTAAAAFPRATSPDTDWLGIVYMNKDTAANRKRAEKDLRKMIPSK